MYSISIGLHVQSVNVMCKAMNVCVCVLAYACEMMLGGDDKTSEVS